MKREEKTKEILTGNSVGQGCQAFPDWGGEDNPRSTSRLSGPSPEHH